MYETQQEAHQKLSQTVVLFDGKPSFIREISGGGGDRIRLHYYFIRDKAERTNYIDEPQWDFRSLGSRLGYANMDLSLGYSIPTNYKEALYLRRAAVRHAHNTQGLSSKNLRFDSFRGAYRLGLPPREAEWHQVLLTKSFCDTLEGVYPTFDAVKDAFKNDSELTSLAFDRHFAIRRHDIGPYYLEYKGKDVGYTDDFRRWKIAPEFQYLTESLDYINFKYID